MVLHLDGASLIIMRSVVVIFVVTILLPLAGFSILLAQGGNYTETVDGVSFKMVFVEGDTFSMGCTGEQMEFCQPWEEPVHRVVLTGYHIGEAEVTFGQFRAFVEATGYRTTAEQMGTSMIWNRVEWEDAAGVNWRHDEWGKERALGDDFYPVMHVSWDDAVAYCSYLSKKTNKTYRLPTEAEWEFAARGGNRSFGYVYSGDNDLGQVAWYKENSNGHVHVVKSKNGNELGLYDMSGNLWEWCHDWDKDYTMSAQFNPKGAKTGTHRINRGGGWFFSPQFQRVSHRRNATPDFRANYIGFRVVCP